MELRLFWLAVSIPVIDTVNDSCWGLKCHLVGDEMCSSKCSVTFGVFLQMWNVMDINDTKKSRISRPKSFGLLTCLWQWQVLQAEQKEVTRECWYFVEVFADCNYLWSKDFLTRNNTFIFDSNERIFLPGIWLIAFWTVQTLASSHKLLWNFSIHCVRNPPLPSLWHLPPAQGCKHPQTMFSAPFLHPAQDFMHSVPTPPVIYFQG